MAMVWMWCYSKMRLQSIYSGCPSCDLSNYSTALKSELFLLLMLLFIMPPTVQRIGQAALSNAVIHLSHARSSKTVHFMAIVTIGQQETPCRVGIRPPKVSKMATRPLSEQLQKHSPGDCTFYMPLENCRMGLTVQYLVTDWFMLLAALQSQC